MSDVHQLDIFSTPRKRTQADQILDTIKRQPGVANHELAHISLKYSSRIAELRRDGYNIIAKREWRQGRATGTYRYWLV